MRTAGQFASIVRNAVRRLLPIFLIAGVNFAHAADDDLYRAQTIVTGQGEENRDVGFAACMQEVLVKVSGDPTLIEEPEVAAMVRDAASYVASFRHHDRMAGIPVHDEQGTRDRPHDLIVSFEPAKIDSALKSIGRAPWTAPRPRIAAFITVRNGATRFGLAHDGQRGTDMRDALAAAAKRFGMSFVLPDRATLTKIGFTPSEGEIAPQKLADAVAAVGGDVALVGEIEWTPKALGWTSRWRLATPNNARRWQVEGGSFDESFRNAFRNAIQILSQNE